MGQTADQIKDEIDNQRQELGDNLQQLEQKVKETVDWKSQFEQKPMLGMGIAFGAGFLLSALMPGGKSGGDKSKQQHTGAYDYQPYSTYSSEPQGEPQSASRFSSSGRQQPKQRAPEMSEITETVDNIKGALLGLGARQLRTFLAQSVPGFKDEYEQARTKRNASPETRIDTDPSSGMGMSSRMSSGSSNASSGPPSGGSVNRTHETQSSYHPDLNAQTPGLDPTASKTAATMPAPDAFSGSSQSTGGTQR